MNEDAIDLVKKFLRTGLTWAEWNAMDDATKALMVEASEQLEVERITALAIAIRSDLGAAEVYSRIDGGDAFVHKSLLDAVARAVTK